MSVEVQSVPVNFAQASPRLDDILNGDIHHDIDDSNPVVWDRGVFLNELQRQGLVLDGTARDCNGAQLVADRRLRQGTYHGTRAALTELYSMLEDSHASNYDTRGLDPIVPLSRSLEDKQNTYKWGTSWTTPFGNCNYPPHLQQGDIPHELRNNTAQVGQLFEMSTLGATGAVVKAFDFVIPKELTNDDYTPYAGPTLADCEAFNRAFIPMPLNVHSDIMDGQNIGALSDWFSDARFAQQHLSGVNPSTIAVAPLQRVQEFVSEASKQGLVNMQKLLSTDKDLLIQDYSYFREATGVKNDEMFQNTIPDSMNPTKPADFTHRYACAPIVLFQLHDDGHLHPLAITLDYKGSLSNSITIFNRRLTPNDISSVAEKDDWPWRYAKTCAQTADWTRHEIASHLVDTHMIEEAIIVATNRTIPEDHLLYEILNPHWFRTLPLNAAARDVLVPGVIARLSGLGPNPLPQTSRAFNLIDWSYKNFNFQDKYVPNDLKLRGFDLDTPGNKYRNYSYAYCISALWAVIREFVESVIITKYSSDDDVRKDKYISDWCTEIQSQGQIPTFPTVTTVEQLIDAVTMCIHTASPQHTAVNYMQNYYYNFVPAKPAALCTPLPADLQTLQAYTEKDLTAALPIGNVDGKWKDWLLSAQLPELLSFRVETRYNLVTYARSLYNVNKARTAFENKQFNAVAIKNAAARFYSQLKDCEKLFEFVSNNQTEGTIEYKVLQPELTAVSILI